MALRQRISNARARVKAAPRRRKILAATGMSLLAVTGGVGLQSCEPPGRVIAPESLPVVRQAATTELVAKATYNPIPGHGEFRTNCFDSHQNFSDPIVFADQPGASHNHTFWGASDMRYDTKSPLNSRGSTCWGGLVNRTGYWTPSMIDGADRYVAPAPIADSLQVYYKCGYRGVPCTSIQWFPEGLKMIAGDSKGAQLRDLTKVWWTCQPDARINQGLPHLAELPDNCPRGAFVQLGVEFPQCWNGRDLDSPDHKSHMAYGLGWPNLGCPPSHPVALPQITEFFRWQSDGNTKDWHTSSDVVGAPDGSSAHADWWNGWNAETGAKIAANCLRAERDCQMNLLGDGTMLIGDPRIGGTRPIPTPVGPEEIIPPVTTSTTTPAAPRGPPGN